MANYAMKSSTYCLRGMRSEFNAPGVYCPEQQGFDQHDTTSAPNYPSASPLQSSATAYFQGHQPRRDITGRYGRSRSHGISH